jgi:hypothetical protein
MTQEQSTSIRNLWKKLSSKIKKGIAFFRKSELLFTCAIEKGGHNVSKFLCICVFYCKYRQEMRYFVLPFKVRKYFLIIFHGKILKLTLAPIFRRGQA